MCGRLFVKFFKYFCYVLNFNFIFKCLWLKDVYILIYKSRFIKYICKYFYN